MPLSLFLAMVAVIGRLCAGYFGICGRCGETRWVRPAGPQRAADLASHKNTTRSLCVPDAPTDRGIPDSKVVTEYAKSRSGAPECARARGACLICRGSAFAGFHKLLPAAGRSTEVAC